ncbi:interleukin-8-like [Genypterus blacodes]|uniref:interleukin-8-like n=1 Tax=Genypterus blacodes TaxID=154954 RepID=UPI003F762F5C
MLAFTIVALLAFLSIPEGSLGAQGVNLRCQCINNQKKPIGRLINQVEVHPANPHCNNMEIIATLKKNGQKVCLDPNVPWVKRVMERNSAVRKS